MISFCSVEDVMNKAACLSKAGLKIASSYRDGLLKPVRHVSAQQVKGLTSKKSFLVLYKTRKIEKPLFAVLEILGTFHVNKQLVTVYIAGTALLAES